MMMSNKMSLFLRHLYKRSTCSRMTCHRFCSSVSKKAELDDPAPLFFNSDVQKLLRKLTRVSSERAFRNRKEGHMLLPPKFKFMTDEGLQQAQDEIQTKLDLILQIPPVVKARSDTIEILATDAALRGYDQSKFVFTDISYGGRTRDRLIVVREPDGTLRHANTNERNRMTQVYYSVDHREIHVPKMFYDPYFKDLLDRGEFEFILDRACIQFEPDDSEYQRIVNEVCSYVNSTKKFNGLRSTRHFGSLAFILAWNKNIDDLLIDVLKSKRIDEAASLIRLYHIIHPDAKSAAEVQTEDEMDLIRCYAKLDATKRKDIEHAVLMYEKFQNTEKEVQEGIKIAHGFNTDENQPESQPN
ncbi:28S ribosomal protein S22, mitochondrial [Colletes gigas]|uniref:28S ribosomal protein S22, mitochondrial n=1 Tax=Colletes gigas TaxID=935657 RepID=UPI001C9A5647|nr:28S ribosomal protein S22, mitochondrial [Colletes gigas]